MTFHVYCHGCKPTLWHPFHGSQFLSPVLLKGFNLSRSRFLIARSKSVRKYNAVDYKLEETDAKSHLIPLPLPSASSSEALLSCQAHIPGLEDYTSGSASDQTHPEDACSPPSAFTSFSQMQPNFGYNDNAYFPPSGMDDYSASSNLTVQLHYPSTGPETNNTLLYPDDNQYPTYDVHTLCDGNSADTPTTNGAGLFYNSSQHYPVSAIHGTSRDLIYPDWTLPFRWLYLINVEIFHLINIILLFHSFNGVICISYCRWIQSFNLFVGSKFGGT